ncbi:MAG: dTDP-4-dehydrorhamnose 3,5-epimerase family protein [Pseudomonadota bacterium]
MDQTAPKDLLSQTLEAAGKDAQSTDATGKETAGLPEGSWLKPAHILTDARGSLFELGSNSRWGEDPIVHVYGVTLRPGVVKGWALHKEHDDRYFILSGDMEVVMYDVRPEARTYGQLFRVTLSEKSRACLRIPAFVWHADHNPGTEDVLLVNMPTKVYDRENPDKYRLPLDTDLIPHDFGDAKGW